MAQELEPRTIKSNLEYRLSKGDLPKLSFGVEKPKNVEVIEGSEELLQDCLERFGDLVARPTSVSAGACSRRVHPKLPRKQLAVHARYLSKGGG